MVKPTLLLLAGILLGDRWPLPMAWLFGVSFAALALAVAWPGARTIFLSAALLAAGWTNQTLHTAVLAPDDLRRLVDAPLLVSVRGQLAEAPSQRVFDRGNEEVWRTLAYVDVTAVRRSGESWRPASGRVAASLPGLPQGSFFAKSPVEMSGVLCPPPGPSVPGQFDYATYLRRLGIYFQLRSDGPSDWRVTGQTEPAVAEGLTERFTHWAQRTLALGLPVQDEPLRLLWAMNLGWKTALTGEVSQPFMRSGTMHVFAISGLHIALIAAIMVAVLRVARVPREGCGLVAIPALWFYTAATGWQSSAVRSSLMMTVVVLGWSLRRPWSLLNSLAVAAFVILCWDPQQLFQASFQLSFAVVLSLALSAPHFQRMTQGWIQPDPFLPSQLRPQWQRALLTVGYWLAGNLSISLAAWVGSLPLIAFYFHLLTPCSLLANLFVVPLAGFALMANLGSLCTGTLLPGITGLFNHAAWFCMVLMMWLSEVCTALPGAWLRVREPTLLEFATYYALVVSLLAGWLRKPGRRAWVATGLALLVAACFVVRSIAGHGSRLTVIPVSGGHVVHCESHERGADLLTDCGNRNGFEFTVAPLLAWAGVNHLPRLILTHGDVRQIGGTELVVREFAPREIVTSSLRFRSPNYREIAEADWFPKTRHHVVQTGDQLGPWRVLHPRSEDRFTRADDAALVLRAELDGVRVLLLNDLGREGQEALLARWPAADLQADIVVAGLPRDGEPLSDGLLERIQPKAVLLAEDDSPATRRAPARSF